MKKVSLMLSFGTFAIIGIILLFSSCNKDSDNSDTLTQNTAPTASFTISPETGSTYNIFLFDASISTDKEDMIPSLKVRWDWENDGLWDTEWSLDKYVNHIYSQEGNYSVSLEVKDTEGLTNESSDSVVVSNMWVKGEPCPKTPQFTYHGQTYNTILIGNQCWMKENLNYATGNSWCYNFDPIYCEMYGRLYEWETIMNGKASSNSVPSGVRGICPNGWHVPSDNEWKILEGTVDTHYGVGSSEWDYQGCRGKDAGTRLKALAGWTQNTGTDAYGFSALPGGIRIHHYGPFERVGDYTYFWSSTEYSYDAAWYRRLNWNCVTRNVGFYDKHAGISLRCVKD